MTAIAFSLAFAVEYRTPHGIAEAPDFGQARTAGSSVEEEEVKLHCPVCHSEIDEVDLMREHLMKEHEISKRQAGFLIQKLQEWKEKPLDPDLFPKAPERWDGPDTTGRRWRK